MPRHLFKRYLPDPEYVRQHRSLRSLSHLIGDPNLWHLNRRSVSRATAIGLFWALIPMPMQMLAAAATAIPVRGNLTLAVALVWLTNPLTMPIVFYANYRVGSWVLGTPPFEQPMEISLSWVEALIETQWEPLYLGSLLMAVTLSLIGYFAVSWFWMHHVRQSWRARQKRGTSER